MGTPPTAVFVGKVTTVTAAWDGGYAWLALVVLANTVASLFYYLRWIVSAYRRADPSLVPLGENRTPHATSRGVAVGAAALTLVLGVGGGLV